MCVMNLKLKTPIDFRDFIYKLRSTENLNSWLVTKLKLYLWTAL